MIRRLAFATLIALSAVLMSGCAGDPVKQMMSNPEIQTKILNAVAGNAEVAEKLVDQLMGSEETRTMVLNRVLSSGEMMQVVMAQMAKDQTMVDGILNMAVQDPEMQTHIMTLFQGMRLAKGTP